MSVKTPRTCTSTWKSIHKLLLGNIKLRSYQKIQFLEMNSNVQSVMNFNPKSWGFSITLNKHYKQH